MQDDKRDTGIASIVVDDAGQNQIIIVPGANEACSEQDIIKARDVIAVADIIMLQYEISLSTVIAAVRLTKEVGTPMLWNPAPAPDRPLTPDELRYVDVITPNKVEAEQLTGIRVKNKDSAARAGKKLLSMGVFGVAITLGKHGAMTLTAGQSAPTFVPAYSVPTVDTVAAGDAFNGALAVKLAEGYALEDAANYANAVAAIAVTRHGAQPSLPTLKEVQHFLQHYGKPPSESYRALPECP